MPAPVQHKAQHQGGVLDDVQRLAPAIEPRGKVRAEDAHHGKGGIEVSLAGVNPPLQLVSSLLAEDLEHAGPVLLVVRVEVLAVEHLEVLGVPHAVEVGGGGKGAQRLVGT